MDDTPKGIFIRELAFCLIKTALFCLIAVLSNIIVLFAWSTVFSRVRMTLSAAYFSFSLFVIVSALVLFAVGRYLIAFDERSPKDYIVPVMIFIAGTVAIAMLSDPLSMVITLSWNSLMQWLIHNMGGSDTLGFPALAGVWFICCCIMWAGVNYRLLQSRAKKIFTISALSCLSIVFLSLNAVGFIISNK